jgi:hypothetical protein
MTTQLPPREQSDAEIRRERESPDVLFEEARRRRRRRWMAGSALTAAAIIAAALILGMAGGGGGGSGSTAHGQPSGSGSAANTGHVTASRLFPGAPSTQHYYTGPGPACTLAPRSRYLPAWSGCVSVTVADVSGNGRRDLILSYSRLSHVSLGGLPPRSRARGQVSKRYPAEQAMLRIVSPDGHVITTPIAYMTTPFDKTPAQLQKAGAAALISVAHVSDEPGKEIFLQTGQISSGSIALAYSLYHGRLVASGVVLAYGGDGGTRANFQCLTGNPPRLIQHRYELVQVIHDAIYGWWNETTTTYAWYGPRLVKVAQSTFKRRVSPSDSVGVGCTKKHRLGSLPNPSGPR